jgi:hypothetical protein
MQMRQSQRPFLFMRLVRLPATNAALNLFRLLDVRGFIRTPDDHVKAKQPALDSFIVR